MNEEERQDYIEIYEAACELLQDMGHSAEVRDDYSGRFMFGETTVGIVTDAPATVVGAQIASVCILEEHLKNSYMEYIPQKQDNMGLDMIYYK